MEASRERRKRWLMWGLMVLPILLALPVLAQEAVTPAGGAAEAHLDSGDTAWMLTSCALVMMMTAPGLAIFYGGLVSQRNVLSTLMHSFFMLCLVSVQWVIVGYTIAFAPDVGGFVGNLQHFFFNGVGMDIKGTIPHTVFSMFQLMFAIITVALISGSIAERMNFAAFALFALLWTTIVYDPLAHWVWGGGWLMKLGALDFAGGTVVHISSGASALIAAIMLGKRIGYPRSIMPPHNVPLTVIGGAMLWFGWYGFNAGSALAANGSAGLAFATTHTATAMAGLTWALLEWMLRGKPTVLGTVTGVVAGLVAITPAAGFVTVQAAMAIGLGAGVFCYWGVNKLKQLFGYDDSLDVVGVHGVGGTWGALATGIFASQGGSTGLLAGNAAQMGPQIIGILASWAWACVGTFVILSIVQLFVPLRVSKEDEMTGLDLSLHDEVAYNTSGLTTAANIKE